MLYIYRKIPVPALSFFLKINMNFEKVINEKQIKSVEILASEIWYQHFIPIIGKSQVDYMLDKFQSAQAIAKQINQGFFYYLILTEKGYIGYFGFLPKKNELFLSKLYLKSSERGKGFGKNAVNFIKKLAEEKQLKKISLTVNKYNTDTIKTYKKMGFLNTGSVVNDIGNGFVMDDYIMEKPV